MMHDLVICQRLVVLPDLLRLCCGFACRYFRGLGRVLPSSCLLTSSLIFAFWFLVFCHNVYNMFRCSHSNFVRTFNICLFDDPMPTVHSWQCFCVRFEEMKHSIKQINRYVQVAVIQSSTKQLVTTYTNFWKLFDVLRFISNWNNLKGVLIKIFNYNISFV